MKRRATAFAMALAATLAAAQGASAPLTREQVERRLASTATLIEQSSGAKQVRASGHADALLQLAKAQELHGQARRFLDAGDAEAANKLLHAAAKTLIEAVGLAAPEQVTGRKERNDFDARLESTRALLDAHKRIAGEKGATARNADLVRTIEGLIREAERLAAAGQLVPARATLDQAYGAAKASIGGLREGDTLVRSLHFASKEEEYRYELDRNETHRMLIQVLLADRRGGSTEALVQAGLQAAQRFRLQADEQARVRDHEGAIRSLEDSTRELVKAIRGAGVYIPG